MKRWEEEQMMKGVTAGVVIDECAGSNNHYSSAESKLRYSDNGDNVSVFSQLNIQHVKVEDGIER